MQDKKLDDPSNQETKEPSLVCMIGDIPNEATAVDNKVRNILFFSPLVPSKREKWYFVTKIVLTYCEKKLF